MHGIYDLDTNIFFCEDETDRLNKNNIIICHKGNLFLDKERELQLILQINKNYPNLENLCDLTGQFAIVIVDRDSKSIMLIRDQFGVVPLYYSVDKGKVTFGTTMTPIIKELNQNLTINDSVIHEYFMFRYISGKNTFFKKIAEVNPGSIIEINQLGELNERSYYNYSYSSKTAVRNAHATELFNNAFWASLVQQTWDKRQVNIGILSSGGIDSSILVSCGQKMLPFLFNTYYIGYADYAHNRIEEVHSLSKLYNTNHEDVFISNKEFSDNLIKTIQGNEEPLNHPSSVSRNCLYQKIQGKTAVLLSGEGADCLYCGYYIFDLINYFYVKNSYRSLSRILAKLLLLNFRLTKYYDKMSKVLNAIILSPDEYAICHGDYVSNQKKTVIDLIDLHVPDHLLENYTSQFLNYTRENILSIILNIYQTYYLAEGLNTITKIGNLYNIEHRHPFIDINLVNTFNQFPWNEKMKFFKRKHQVIELGKRFLPRDFFKKPKEGFGVPLYAWFHDKNNLGRFVNLLVDKKTRERGIFNTKQLDELIFKYHHKTLPAELFEGIIWPIINLELWYRIFIDKDLKGYE
jgi:asparagine synthase (glutamine-hydrolysing)